MASIGLGVTVGSHSLRAVKLRRKGAGFVVQKVFADRLDESTRPVAGRALAARGFSGAAATLGLTGRDVIIRYSQVPPVPEWRLRNLMKFEVEEVGGQSGGDVSADYKKLNLPDPEGTRGEDTILVALARNRYLDEQLKSLASGGIKVAAACPNSVALFNAFAVNATYTEEETAILVNVGAADVDIAIQRGGELLFARNATPGGKAFTDALAQAFSTTEGKAEAMKLSKGDVTPKAQAKYADGAAEKVANAMMGVAGQLSSLIQGTLMIARAQTRMSDLRIDRVLLAGGGASLKGLDLYLKQAMGVPVERFNPFVLCDLTGLPEDEKQLVEAAPHEFAVAVGLAQTPLAPAAFALEVLPTALRRQRDFWTKTVFAVGAAVVMIGVLVGIANGRKQAAAAYDEEEGRLSRRMAEVKRADGGVREALSLSQENEIKHRLLGERAAPTALLAQVWAELATHLSANPNVYLQSVNLRVKEETNEFRYVRPLRRDSGSGYDDKGVRDTEPVRSRHAWAEVVLRVSGGERQDAVAAAFTKACEGNSRGLLVDSPLTFKGGKPGEDGTFQLNFWPGEVLTPPGSQGRSRVLSALELDDPAAPKAFVGFAPDGTKTRVPFGEVMQKDVKRVLAAHFPDLSPEQVKDIVAAAGSDASSN